MSVVRASIVATAALALLPATCWSITTVSYSSATGLLIQGDAAPEGVLVNTHTGPDRVEVVRAGFHGAATPPATLVAGSGCSTPSNILVSCSLTGARVVTANLGDGRDGFGGTGGDIPMAVFVEAGGGDDSVRGGNGADLIRGGPGADDLTGGGEDAPGANDVIEGGEGSDRFEGDGGGTNTLRGENGSDTFVADFDSVSADLFDGGPGNDKADYHQRTQAVTLKASLQSTPTPDDGQPGEGDDLDSVETLTGGRTADTIEFSNSGSMALLGKGSPPRRLNGNEGADTLRVVGNLKTTLDGGLGRDTVVGGPHADTVFSREGEVDTIDCGGGIDTLTSDLTDTFGACESVNEGEVRESDHVTFRGASVKVGEDGSLSVLLRCPRSIRNGCRGALAARVDRKGTRFGSAERYSIARGNASTIEVELPESQTAAARRRGARVALRSVERGIHGKPRTTLRSLRARPR